MLNLDEIIKNGEYAYKRPKTRLKAYKIYLLNVRDGAKNARNKAILTVMIAEVCYDMGNKELALSYLNEIQSPFILPMAMLDRRDALMLKIKPDEFDPMKFISMIRLLGAINHKGDN